MTGGRLWLYDPDGRVASRLNRGSVVARPAVELERDEDGGAALLELRELVADHAEQGSHRAARLLEAWTSVLASFVLVEPANPSIRRSPASGQLPPIRPDQPPATTPAGSATVVGRTSRSGSVHDQAAPWNLPTAP